MPHEKIERLSGVPYVGHTRHSHFDHNPHMSAGSVDISGTEKDFERYKHSEIESGRRNYGGVIGKKLTPKEREYMRGT